MWVKIWSSRGEDRTHSENAGDYSARLCLNPLNETDPSRDTNVCTGFVRPIDTWQYLSLDAMAVQDKMAVILHSTPIDPNLPTHNEAIWDDVSLTISSAAATVTPPPRDHRSVLSPSHSTLARGPVTQSGWLLFVYVWQANVYSQVVTFHTAVWLTFVLVKNRPAYPVVWEEGG